MSATNPHPLNDFGLVSEARGLMVEIRRRESLLDALNVAKKAVDDNTAAIDSKKKALGQQAELYHHHPLVILVDGIACYVSLPDKSYPSIPPNVQFLPPHGLPRL